MGRLSVLVFLSTAFLALVLGASVALGRATPLPEEVAGLHLDELCKLPCWLGITPGKTMIWEVQDLITNIYGHVELEQQADSQSDFLVSLSMPNGKRWNVLLRANLERVVIQIMLTPENSNNIPLGDAINRLGIPKTVYTQYATLFLYDGYRIGSSARQLSFTHYEGISPRQALTGIMLYDDDWSPSVNLSGPNASRWRGFGVYQYWVNPNMIAGDE